VTVSADAVMTELQGRVRERLRLQLLQSGGSRAFEDPALFAEVEAMLAAAANTSETSTLLLPELLGDPATWRLSTKAPYQSHRSAGAASIVLFAKRRLLMPVGQRNEVTIEPKPRAERQLRQHGLV